MICDERMKVYLICGYRRTGKDSLCTALLNNNPESHHKWRIYKHPKCIDKYFDPTCDTKYLRTGFADALKEEAAKQYGIPVTIPDSDKDNKQYVHYRSGDIVSARDIYIEWGALRRLQDEDYWCKAAFNTNNTDINGYIVTDWRFTNEHAYTSKKYDVTTVRVYRSEVPEPQSDIKSEHDLDDFCTDFLLIPDDIQDEFEKAVARFPQYKDHIMCELLE